jgi:hypothetical protein
MNRHTDAPRQALSTLRTNHEWHTVHGEEDYPDSELYEHNLSAIYALEAYLEKKHHDYALGIATGVLCALFLFAVFVHGSGV